MRYTKDKGNILLVDPSLHPIPHPHQALRHSIAYLRHRFPIALNLLMLPAYLFDTLEELGIISDILDWEVRLHLHENKFNHTQISMSNSTFYKQHIKKWGDK